MSHAHDRDDQYTDPELRHRIKDELMRSDRGGAAGTWSARKSQLLVQEYERQGGGYRGPRDDAARSLERWTEQDWRTRDGGTRAREGGSTRRYLPKKAWEEMSESERAAADARKRRGSRRGEQHVSYGEAESRALHPADAEPTRAELYEEARRLGVEGRSRMKKDELRRAVRVAQR